MTNHLFKKRLILEIRIFTGTGNCSEMMYDEIYYDERIKEWFLVKDQYESS
jgi:hypothetical protein